MVGDPQNNPPVPRRNSTNKIIPGLYLPDSAIEGFGFNISDVLIALLLLQKLKDSVLTFPTC